MCTKWMHWRATHEDGGVKTTLVRFDLSVHHCRNKKQSPEGDF